MLNRKPRPIQTEYIKPSRIELWWWGRSIPFLTLLFVLTCIFCAPSSAAGARRLPVEAFAQDGYLTAPALSPSGDFLAGFVHHEGQNVVLVWNLATDERTPIARLDARKQYLHRIFWSNENRLMVSTSQPNSFSFIDGSVGRTNWLVGMDRDGGNQEIYAHNWRRLNDRNGTVDARSRKMLPMVRSGANLLSMLDHDPTGVLLQIERYGKNGASAYRMDTNTGRLRLVQSTTPGIIQWYADHDGVIRMGYGADRRMGNRWIIARSSADGEFREVARWDVLQGESGIYPLGFGFDGRTAYVAAPSAKGTKGVFEFDLAKGKLGKLVFAHDKYDVGGLRFDTRKRVLEGVRWIGDTQEIHFLDKKAEREHAALQKAIGAGTLWLVDESSDASKRLYLVESGDQAPRYYLYDRKARTLEELYSLLPQITDAATASVQKIHYTARDGYQISGYLTLPFGKKGHDLPAVVFPHGGPWSRDSDSFDRMAQFLANSGFAVLQMNFRGSTGLGASHKTAGYRELGMKIQNDITDGAKWMIRKGIANPDRIAIYGASHGGYAALMGMARNPELYRCGAALAPVTDLHAFVDSMKWNLYGAANRVAWGDLRQPGEAERLRANSPLNLADKIVGPLLLAHGRHDKIVPRKHTEWMVEALEAEGRSPQVAYYEDWHGFIHQPNRIDFYSKLQAFLVECTSK